MKILHLHVTVNQLSVIYKFSKILIKYSRVLEIAN